MVYGIGIVTFTIDCFHLTNTLIFLLSWLKKQIEDPTCE